MGRKNKRKRPNVNKHLCIYGRLARKNNAVAYCKLHKCYLEPKDIAEKKCNYKRCTYKQELQRRKTNGNKSIIN